MFALYNVYVFSWQIFNHVLFPMNLPRSKTRIKFCHKQKLSGALKKRAAFLWLNQFYISLFHRCIHSQIANPVAVFACFSKRPFVLQTTFEHHLPRIRIIRIVFCGDTVDAHFFQ